MTCWVVANTISGMIQQGLSVPPPLRRGGGQRISTALSIPPSGRAANPASASKDPAKARQVRRKKLGSEDTESDHYGSDSDAEYGKPRAKRTKIRSKVKARTPTPSTSDSEEEIESPEGSDVKREGSSHSTDNPSAEEGSLGADETDEEDVVAAGAGFLDLDGKSPTMVDNAPESSKSLIVKLPAKKAIKPEGSSSARSDLNSLATVAGGLPSYTGSYSIGNYQGLDLSLQNHGHYSQADHAHSNSGYLSAGYGGMDGLPESSLYGSMISQPHRSFSTGVEHFGDPSLGDQGVVEDHWNPTNSDYLSGGYGSSLATNTPRFLNARGTSTIMRHPRSSLSHLATSFISEPAVEDGMIGGEYHSPGLSTLDQTPASNLPEDSAGVPWLTRDVSSAGQTSGMELDNVDTAQASDLYQQYDSHGDGNVYF